MPVYSPVLIFGAIALNDADSLVQSLQTMDAAAKDAKLDELASRVIFPYIMIAGVLAALAIAVLLSGLPDIKEDGEDAVSGAPSESANKTSIFQFPHLLLGVLAIFLYVGVEVMAGDTIISYGKSLDIDLSIARYFTQGTLGIYVSRLFCWNFCHSKISVSTRCFKVVRYSWFDLYPSGCRHNKICFSGIYCGIGSR